ncbi:hypothetical protein [Thalassotalea maritima]|uniref:hypothetical protein n=1 Tax=Thalassotalea maritima TaxID=3242416 RepID=UPI0035299E74
MSKSITTYILLMVTMIALIGQSFAFATTKCDMASHEAHHKGHSSEHSATSKRSSAEHDFMPHRVTHSATEHSEMNHHAMHEHMLGDSDIASYSATVAENCCGTECTCPDNACSSTSAVASHAYSIAYLVNLPARIVTEQQHAMRLSRSLYRPPIFA